MRAPVRYHFLDVLRGLAALWVFVHHLPFRSSYPEKYPQLEAFCRLGHLGVPMFFVISGFCLMASLRSAQRKGEGPRSFLYRRFRRIYPPFWCSLVVFLGMPYLLELISSLRTGSFLRPAFPFAEEGKLFWIRIGTLSQVFVPGFPNLPTKFSGINPPNWSLAIEVQFYVVMALCLEFSHRMSKWILLTVTLVSVPLTLIPCAYNIGIFLPYWPMFAIGILLYCVLEGNFWPTRILANRVVAAICLGVLLGLILCFKSLTIGSLELNHHLFAIGLAFVLWLGHSLDSLWSKAIVSQNLLIFSIAKVFTFLGAMSYTVYLLHGAVTYLAAQLIRQVMPETSMGFPPAIVAGTLVMCIPFYFLCERPFIKPSESTKRPS